jgi:uncharacterized iron-regulated membrane protein/flavodoxin
MKLPDKIIFWSHLLAGTVGGVVIFIMSATGFMVMYERQLVEFAERDVRQVAAPGAGAQRLGLAELVAKAREQNPKAQVTGVVLRNEPTASVAVNFGREGANYVNPYTGAVLGEESKLHDWFHEVIEWHRWLGTEGEGRATARAITGACNLAFFWLAVTGVYLWWPRSWHWRGLKSSLLFNLHLRGKARDWNWHNVIGFWSSSVLVVLTLTAAVMSYPWANDLLFTLTGSEPPPRAQPSGPMAQTQQRRGAGAEPRSRKPLASFDAFLARAEQQAPGWIMMTMRLPPRGDGPVTLLIQEPTAPHIFARSQLVLNRASAAVVKWEPYGAASPGRKLRTWVRGLHTGEALGFAGQTVAGLASLGGCFLVWTGFAMAWRRFRYRKRDAEVASTVEYQIAPVEAAPTVIQTLPQNNKIAEELASIPMEETNSNFSNNGHSHNGHDHTSAELTGAPGNNDSVLILYGTVTGNAEMLAKKLATALRRANITAQMCDMARCETNLLKQANCVLMVVSTYGDGEPPDDATPFWQALVHGNGLDLSGIKFSVLALGNTTYDHFCKCGRDFDAALERHGAARIYPRVDCDVDYDEPAKRWFDGVLAQFEKDQRTALSAETKGEPSWPS